MPSLLYLWPMLAAACLTLAAVHGLASAGRREARPNLLFAILATLVATLAVCELLMAEADTPRRFALLQRWTHLPLFLTLVSLVAFVRAAFGTGRSWLAALFVAVRVLVLVVNFSSDVSFNYRSITAIHRLDLLGTTISFAEGEPSPWTLLGSATGLAALAFVIDASRELWRRGQGSDRRRAATVGGALVVWVVLMMTSDVITHTGEVHPPYFLAFSFLPVITAASFELSRDLIQVGQLKDELRETEQRLDLAVLAAGLGVWSWDLRRDSISASSEARRMFGIGDDEPLRFAGFLAAVHPDERSAVEAAVQDAILSGADYQTEYRVGRAGEAPRWIAARGRIEREPDGIPRQMRGVVFDVTARHRSELEAQELRSALAHSERVNATGQLAAALVHELSQPLAAILRNAEAATLLLDEPRPDTAELRSIVNDIHRDDQRAAAVIQRLRGLLARGRLEARRLAVAPLVHDVVALLRSEAVRRSVTLWADVAPDLPDVHGDAVQLQQVLLNLLLNGMDAVGEQPSGDRTVAVSARALTDQRLALEVTDSGRGIPEGDRERVFERFFTTKSGGMGLGLPISRTIVEAHGGALTAHDDSAGGATFRVVLPAGPVTAT